MSGFDRLRVITGADALVDHAVHLMWSDGTSVDVDCAALREGTTAAAPTVGDWGHSLVWPDGMEVGADRIWLETLTALGRDDARQFLDWRLRNGLSLANAAEALGIARRSVAYYSNGDRPVPKAILLACRGWEVSGERLRAA